MPARVHRPHYFNRQHDGEYFYESFGFSILGEGKRTMKTEWDQVSYGGVFNRQILSGKYMRLMSLLSTAFFDRYRVQ